MGDPIDSGDTPRPESADAAPDAAPVGPSTEERLALARARLKLAAEAESEIRRLALEDLTFRSGEQWPDKIKAERARDDRPCLVINRLPQFVQQVTNDQRQNRPSIKVHPVDDQADVETAKVIQGLIRHIEYNSSADVAYDTAFEAAATGGFGYFRIITAFEDPESFDQEILIKRIRNPFSVFYDPSVQEPDGSDAGWAFITTDYTREDYQAAFPESELAKPEADWDAIGNDHPEWMTDGSIRVAEYFSKEMEEATLYQLSNGVAVLEKNLATHLEAAAQANLPLSVVKKRKTQIPVVTWIKTNGVEILEETIWPGSHIPIIPVYGTELFIDGKRVLEGIVRHAKDPQRMYNYWASAETETIALAPRAPFIGAEGQFEGHEAKWRTANRMNHAFLEYKPKSVNGELAPPPARQSFEPAVQAITQARMMSADDLKATTGIYDAALGAQSNEISGVAIQGRSRQSQTSTFHLVDNLSRSLKHAGRILVDLLPHVYDTERSARIIGEDGTEDVVKLNEKHQDESGKDVLYDLSTGRYDVTIDVGPSYATRRQEAAASMMDFSRAVPQVASACADLIVKNLDWPGADAMAERLRKLLPPNLQDDPKTKDVPPQLLAQLQQQGQMIQGLTEHLNEANKVIETKKLDLDHKERVEAWNIQLEREKLQAEIEINLAKLGTQSSIEMLKQEIGAIKHENALLNDRLQLLNVNAPIGAPDDFNASEADGGNYAGIGHIGGGENLTGGGSPGSSMEGNHP